jgi:FMN reductase
MPPPAGVAKGVSAPLAVVVGNPKRRSRTLAVADAVATAAAAAVGLEPEAERLTIDLADFGGELFDWSSLRVREIVAGLTGASLAVIASPTYKATYTGLLKAYLDWFGQTGLSGVTVVPVMVGAAPHHALAVEVHLRPVLVEIGASVPTRGLYVTEDAIDDLPSIIDAWLGEAGPVLARAVRRP